MQNIPRICAALVIGGFFLPWISVDFLGAKMSITGMQFATAKGPLGDASYALLGAPVLALIAALVHQRKMYGYAAVIGGVVMFLWGPVLLKDGAAEMGVSRGIGLYMCLAGLVAMIVTAICISGVPSGNEPKTDSTNQNEAVGSDNEPGKMESSDS
tara:strand:+ start:693 stop:1160 length:468 start_codon:yes stop_codon:yes gene_type:complete